MNRSQCIAVDLLWTQLAGGSRVFDIVDPKRTNLHELLSAVVTPIDMIALLPFDPGMKIQTTSVSADSPLPSTVQRLSPLMAEALITLLFLILAIDPWVGGPFAEFWKQQGYRPLDLDHPTLLALVMVEVGFLLPQLTLTDLATRLKQRPPWWLIPVIVVGVLLLAPGGAEFARVVLANQSLLLLPALWSVSHRARQLWDLPGKPALERMRVRALACGRANVGGLMVVIFVVASMAQSFGLFRIDDWFWQDKLLLGLITIYFGACTFDAWRVTGARFKVNPKPLLGFDFLGVKDVDMPL